MSVPLVFVDQVARRYGAVEALVDVSFRVDAPGVTGLLGPNGAGKTSLLDLLSGLARPSSGSLALFGERLDQKPYPRRRVGVVLQREFVPDRVTVAEYAELFAAIYGIDGGARAILRQAELLERGKVPVDSLSGGEAQRLFVAAAVVHGPELLLLDEPSSGLDPASKRALGDFLRQIAEKTCVLLATHDLNEAERICDHCLFIVGGRLRAEGTPQQLLTSAAAASLEDAFFYYCGARVNTVGDST
ncbi:MAG TPA: ABC transporter ATP-binding protein [Polyangiaceae bacterium]|nr:ABC transporter ATP-binding protein [Polyangiaceae bacterium]